MNQQDFDEFYGDEPYNSDELFGLDVENLSDLTIRYQMEYHREQIKRGQVGTPNVYVRLGDLEREAESRGMDISLKMCAYCHIVEVDDEDETETFEYQNQEVTGVVCSDCFMNIPYRLEYLEE